MTSSAPNPTNSDHVFVSQERTSRTVSFLSAALSNSTSCGEHVGGKSIQRFLPYIFVEMEYEQSFEKGLATTSPRRFPAVKLTNVAVHWSKRLGTTKVLGDRKRVRPTCCIFEDFFHAHHKAKVIRGRMTVVPVHPVIDADHRYAIQLGINVTACLSNLQRKMPILRIRNQHPILPLA